MMITQLSLLSNTQRQPETLIKVLIVLLLTLPFLLPWYYPPYTGFYTDMVVGMLTSLFAIYLLFNTLKLKSCITAAGLLMFALYLPLQSLLIQFPYIGSSLYISSFYILVALLLLTFMSVPKEIFIYITSSVLWGIFILASIQLCLYLIQLAITDVQVKEKLDWILFSGTGGQVGQRNNFSHIMMWGLITSIILERTNKISIIKMWILVLVYSIAMAHSGSRAVILYIVGLSLMAAYQMFMVKENNIKVFSRNVLIALAIVLFAQFAFPFILNNFISSGISSGADRLIGSSEYLSRWLEWQKAWLAFLDAPLLGHGWGSYGFQSFWYHDQVATIGMPRANDYFAHSHNLILQLLVEVGLLGTLILVAPIAFILLKTFFKYKSDVTTFGLLMICVISLIHSMVEFPLWHSNFLIVFFIVLFLIVRKVTPNHDIENKEHLEYSMRPYIEQSIYVKLSIVSALVMMVSVLIILFDHEKKVDEILTLGSDMPNAQSVAIGRQGQYILFYDKYADWLDTSTVNPNIEDIEQMLRSDNLLVNNMQVFPYYTHMAAHIIYLQKMGNKDEAELWLDKTSLYYPRVLPGLIRLTEQYPEGLGNLQNSIVKKCEEALASQMYDLKPEHCLIPIVENQ